MTCLGHYLYGPRGHLGSIYNESIIYWSTQHMNALGHIVSEKKVFICFSKCKYKGAIDPPGWGNFSPQGHSWQDLCKASNYNAAYQIKKLWLLWFQRRRFFHVFSIVSLWQIMMPQGGACIDPRATVSKIYKEDDYTLLHTIYKSSAPCGFGEEDFLCFFFP